MAKPPPPDIAVNKEAGAKVRIELLRRGWKVRDLANKISLASDTVTNVLCGKRHLSARIAIEDVLEMPFWSTPEEFAARQRAAKPIKK